MNLEENERDVLPLVAAVVLVLALVSGGIWWLVKGGSDAVPKVPVAPVADAGSGKSGLSPANLTEGAEDSSQEVLNSLGVVVESADPSEVAESIAQLLASGDFESAGRALGGGENGVSIEALRALQSQMSEQGLDLRKVREVGELEINRRKRFALETETGASPLFLDLTRGKDGQWSVDTVRIPESSSSETADGNSLETGVGGQDGVAGESDSLAVSDAFLQAALGQNFGIAKSLVDDSGVTDVKIAALCILFEEGKYRLNPGKPLRALFIREESAHYLVNVLTADAEQTPQFGLILKRDSEAHEWKVSEINFDALLADYAGRYAGGDTYYTPLVSNPEGGETLVIFFEFDEKTLAPRTARQLNIVSEVLLNGPERKLTISGHADSLGSDDYNRDLSQKRAEAVRDYLVEQGVKRSQVILDAQGESRPRRPNQTETGEDSPEGRRANRRTEIYLDF